MPAVVEGYVHEVGNAEVIHLLQGDANAVPEVMKDVGQRYRACEDESVALTRFGYSGVTN